MCDVNVTSLCASGRGSTKAMCQNLRGTEKFSFRVRPPPLAASAEAIKQP